MQQEIQASQARSLTWFISCYLTFITNSLTNLANCKLCLCAYCATSLFPYTGYTQKNGAVSKVNKKFISHLTRAQRTPSAAATIQVSHALPAVRFSCLLRGRGANFQDGVAARKGFLLRRHLGNWPRSPAVSTSERW